METKKYPSVHEIGLGGILYSMTDHDIHPFKILDFDVIDSDWVNINDHFNFWRDDSESEWTFGSNVAFTTMEEAKECLLKRLNDKLLKLTEEVNKTVETIAHIEKKQSYEEKV